MWFDLVSTLCAVGTHCLYLGIIINITCILIYKENLHFLTENICTTQLCFFGFCSPTFWKSKAGINSVCTDQYVDIFPRRSMKNCPYFTIYNMGDFCNYQAYIICKQLIKPVMVISKIAKEQWLIIRVDLISPCLLFTPRLLLHVQASLLVIPNDWPPGLRTK